MSSDVVYLLVTGKRIQNFKSYAADADLYAAGDAFTFELARPETTIKPGMQAELYINDRLELTGIIDRYNPRYDKEGRRLIVTGRDLMGWCVDAHATKFVTVQNYTLKSLAETLLANAPFIDIKNIQYQENVKGRIKSKGPRTQVGIFDMETALSQIEPGMSIFEILSGYAKSKGLLFYAMPDGTFVFGKPKEKGAPAFSLVRRKSGAGNNILEGELDDDISKRYSQVTVVGQQQGTDPLSASLINVEATVTDPDFPFFKPFVLKDEYGGNQPKLQARMALEKMRHDGFKLQYVVQGHSQQNKNWSINELCQVTDEDDDFNVNDVYLIYGRTFEKSRDRGTLTKLRLGLPGLIAGGTK